MLQPPKPAKGKLSKAEKEKLKQEEEERKAEEDGLYILFSSDLTRRKNYYVQVSHIDNNEVDNFFMT